MQHRAEPDTPSAKVGRACVALLWWHYLAVVGGRITLIGCWAKQIIAHHPLMPLFCPPRDLISYSRFIQMQHSASSWCCWVAQIVFSCSCCLCVVLKCRFSAEAQTMWVDTTVLLLLLTLIWFCVSSQDFFFQDRTVNIAVKFIQDFGWMLMFPVSAGSVNREMLTG